MMPKHVFEAQDDPLAYKFNPADQLGFLRPQGLRLQWGMVHLGTPRRLATDYGCPLWHAGAEVRHVH